MTGGDIKFEALNRAALAACPGLLLEWFPAGVARGRWFHIGDLAGNAGDSLYASLSTGQWKDANPDREEGGGDLISLYAAKEGIGQAEAARALAAKLGRPELAPGGAADAGGGRHGGAGLAPDSASAQSDDIFEPMLVPVRDAPTRRQVWHPMFGMPHRMWIYHTAEGAPAFAVCRWDDKPAKGKKTILPYAHGRRRWTDGKGQARDEVGWHFKHAPAPRPLYGLERLAALPGAPVLVVEGEKARDAADGMLEAMKRGAWVVTTWAAGTANAASADWTVLAGRRVVIWPDADRKRDSQGALRPALEQPGMKAARRIAGLLEGVAASVEIIDPPGAPYGTAADARIEAVDGWDPADAEAAGWNGATLQSWIGTHAHVWRPDDAVVGEVGSPPPSTAVDGGGGPGGSSLGSDDTESEDSKHRRTLKLTPLGTLNGTYYFFSPAGERRALTGAQMSENGLASLFDGDTDWLFEHFGRYNRDGAPTGFRDKAAAAWLMRACAEEGLWDPATPVRKLGVWRDGAGLLIHCGDEVCLDGTWGPAGVKRGNSIYPATPPIPRPAAEPAGVEAGVYLRETFARWEFENPAGPDLLTGFIGAALLGGAPAWRAHLYVLAPHAAGKTKLAEAVAAVLGAAAHPQANNYSEAGLRDAMTGEARTVILDEAEGGEGDWRIKEVIKMVRRMSSGAGARTLRGTPSGQAQSFEVTGCAYLTSILHAYLAPQDESRFTKLRLKPLPKGPEMVEAEKDLERRIAKLAELSPGLRARAIEGWRRFGELFDAWRGALLAAGCNTRQADQLGTLAAGRDLLLRDDVPEAAGLADEVDQLFGPLIAAGALEDEESGEGMECLSRLLTTAPDRWRAGDRQTVGEMIIEGLGPSGREARRALERMGLKLINWQDPSLAILLVANRHTELERQIFAGSRWERGLHKQALRYLDGAEAYPASGSGKSVPFFRGAPRTRATAIPARHLPIAEPKAADDAGQADDEL